MSEGALLENIAVLPMVQEEPGLSVVTKMRNKYDIVMDRDKRPGVLSSQDLNQIITNGDDSYILVDCREQHEVDSGTIVPLSQLINIKVNNSLVKQGQDTVIKKKSDVYKELMGLDKKKEIIVYCESGNRSQKIAKALAKRGYNVFSLSGGIAGYEDAGFELCED